MPPAITVVGELIKTAAHNPSVRAAGGELGKAAHTIAKTINIALLPLAAINFGYERAKHYFDENFRPDLEAKLAGLSAEEIVEPKASLAGPVLQGLAFTHEEAALKDMYLNLLASAMKRGEATRAHPAFAEVIKERLKSAHATGPVVAAPGRFSMTAFGSQFAQVVDAQGMFVTALAAPKAQ